MNINIIQKNPEPKNEESETAQKALNEINEFVKSVKEGNSSSVVIPKNVLKM